MYKNGTYKQILPYYCNVIRNKNNLKIIPLLFG